MKTRWVGSVLAVDIGGTKTVAARVTGEGEVVSRRREPTATGGPASVIDQLTRMLRDLMDDAAHQAIVAIGIGIPAVLEHGSDRVIWGPNLPGFQDVRLREPLEAMLQLPVFIEYDGHTAVLGEWWRGAGRGFQNVVFVIIGTGIGGGMILDGRLYRGVSRLAGAAGWFTLSTESDPGGPARQYGHWEALAAGPGIVRRAVNALQSGRPSILPSKELTTEQVFDAARIGDPLACAIVAETAHIIGIGVANIVSLVNPDLVILGGGIGKQADLLLEPVRQVVRDQAQPISGRAVRIEVSQLGEDAGLLGAAYAAWRGCWSSRGSLCKF